MFSKNDVFLKNNLVFFVGSMLVAFFNYLLYPFLARMMTLADFGEVQTLISLSAQFSIFLGVISLVSINIISNVESEEDHNVIINIIQKLTLVSSLLILLLVIIFKQRLQLFFNFFSSWPFVCLAFLLPAGVVFTIRSAILQSRNDFKNMALANSVVAVGRLFLALLLVYSGWRVLGVIGSLLVAQLLGLLYLFFKTKGDLKLKHSIKQIFLLDKKAILSGLKYVFFVFCGLGLITYLYCGDILVVKHFFTSETAGLYSGVSTVARIIFFATIPIAMVMLPNIKLKNSLSENRHYLLTSLLLVSLIGGLVCLFFCLFPVFTINLLIGGRYLSLVSIFLRLSFLMLLISFVNLFLYYSLALRRYFFVLVLGGGVLTNLLLSHYFHADLLQVINNFLISILAILLVLAVKFFGKKLCLN